MIDNFNCTDIIPIGSNCRIGIALRNLGLRSSSMPLDWCLSSMRCVNSLFDDGFSDLTNPVYCSEEVFTMPNGVKHNYILNRKYNLNITHEESISKEFIEKYNRRILRMKEILNKEESKVLFIRNTLDGKIHDPLHAYYLKTDYESELDDSDPNLIDLFVDVVEKKYPNLEFKVLVINHKDPLIFRSNRIHNITTNVNQDDRLWDEKACLSNLRWLNEMRSK